MTEKKKISYGIIISIVLFLVQIGIYAVLCYKSFDEKMKIIIFAGAMVVAMINLCVLWNVD